MANPLDWWSAIDKYFNMNAMREYMDKAEEGTPDIFRPAVSAALKVPRAIPDIVETVSPVISIPAAALGTAMSESTGFQATDPMGADKDYGAPPVTPSRLSAEDAVKAVSEGTKAGQEAALENITMLDIAPSVLGMASKAARGAGALRSAANLARADMALSGVDASVGAAQVATGIRDRDFLKTLMGAARVAGNAYSGYRAGQDIGEISSLRNRGELIEPLEDQIARGGPVSPATSDKYHPHLRAEDTNGNEVSLIYEPNEIPDGLSPAAVRRIEQAAKASIEEVTSDYDRAFSLAEQATFIRSVVDEINSREIGGYTIDDGPLPPGRPTRRAPGLAKVVEEAYGRADEIDMIIKGSAPPNAIDVLRHPSEFLGYLFNSPAYGKRYMGDPKLSYGSNKFVINPQKIAEEAHGSLRDLISGHMTDEQQGDLLYGLSPSVRDYAKHISEGGIRIPETEKVVLGEFYKNHLLYTIIHEAYGHQIRDSYHNAPLDELAAPGWSIRSQPYRTTEMIGVGQRISPGVFTRGDLPRPLVKGQNLDTFSAINNEIFRIMHDPERLAGTKAVLDTPKMQAAMQKWAQDMMPKSLRNSDFGLDPKVPMRTDRVTNRSAVREAKQEVENEPPTPPSQNPPAPPQPYGPQLPTLAERIKQAFLDQGKVAKQADSQRKLIKTAQANALRELDEKLASNQIDLSTFEAERARIRSGSMDLEKHAQGMAITEQEKFAMAQRLAIELQEDQFLRQRVQDSWNKLFNGERLQDAELIELKTHLIEKVTDLQDSWATKVGNFFAESAGGVRAIRTAWDLSAAGRQALYASIMNPSAMSKAFKAQIQALRMTDPEFETFMIRLRDPDVNPFANLAESAGLHFSETMDKAKGDIRGEEVFSYGRWAEKVPGVRASERAYIAYLNKIRVELFNKGVKKLIDDGIAIVDAQDGASQAVRDWAYAVNTLTGRGEMSLFHISPASWAGKKISPSEVWAPGESVTKRMHQALTTVFFAPRFQASRLALMRDATMGLVGGNLHPSVYKMYMKNLYGTLAIITSTVASLAAMGVGTFETDPRKKDFGVLRVGKVRYDAYGSLKQWARLFAKMGEDRLYEHARGQGGTRHQVGEKFRMVSQFGRGKLSPVASLILTAVTGEDHLGREMKYGQLLKSTFLPMIAETVIDVINEEEADQLGLAIPASVVGIGVNAYDERKKR